MATLTDIYDTNTTPVEVIVEEVITPDITTGTAVYRVLDSSQPTYAVAPPEVGGDLRLIVDATNYFPVVSMLWSGHALRLICTDDWHLDLAFVATDVRVDPISGPQSRRRVDVRLLQVTSTAPAALP